MREHTHIATSWEPTVRLLRVAAASASECILDSACLCVCQLYLHAIFFFLILIFLIKRLYICSRVSLSVCLCRRPRAVPSLCQPRLPPFAPRFWPWDSVRVFRRPKQQASVYSPWQLHYFASFQICATLIKKKKKKKEHSKALLVFLESKARGNLSKRKDNALNKSEAKHKFALRSTQKMQRIICTLKTLQKFSLQRRTLHTLNRRHVGGVTEVQWC